MKNLLAPIAGAALLALAGPVSAQMYQPVQPAPMQPPPMQMTQPMPAAPAQPPTYTSGALPPWMQDDGSSSTHPTPMPGDVSGDRLNAQYRNGVMVPPGAGLPAAPDQQ